MSRVCRFLGLSCLGFVVSRVCRVQGLSCLGFCCLGFVVSRVALSRVGYGTKISILKLIQEITIIFSLTAVIAPRFVGYVHIIFAEEIPFNNYF